MFQSNEDRSLLVDLADGVLTMTFNRPEFGNAIPSANSPFILELFRNAQASPQVRCILIRGEGKIFSAGGDVAAFGRSLEQSPAERQADFGARLKRLRLLVEAVTGFDRPIVACVRGAAAGAGLLYPLAADVVLGDETACFVFAHQRVGLSPDGGVSAVLPQVVGLRMARHLLLTSAKVDAPEALRLGMLTRIVPADDLEEEARKTARRLARAPQTAMRHAKAMLNASPYRSLGDQLDAETDGIVACVGDPDFEEGVRAFLEKRLTDFPSAKG